MTGLVAQQQCVGPLHTPLADVAVTALSHFSTVRVCQSKRHPHSVVFDVASRNLQLITSNCLCASQVGSATAIGEQPIKGLISPSSGAQMTVGEALTNLVFAKITDLKVSELIQ